MLETSYVYERWVKTSVRSSFFWDWLPCFFSMLKPPTLTFRILPSSMPSMLRHHLSRTACLFTEGLPCRWPRDVWKGGKVVKINFLKTSCDLVILKNLDKHVMTDIFEYLPKWVFLKHIIRQQQPFVFVYFQNDSGSNWPVRTWDDNYNENLPVFGDTSSSTILLCIWTLLYLGIVAADHKRKAIYERQVKILSFSSNGKSYKILEYREM